MSENITSGIYFKFPNFWFQNGAQRYECAHERYIRTLFKERFMAAGIFPTAELFQKTFLRICAEQSIDFVYPDLPGYPTGIIPGTRILVPSALPSIQPAPGNCDLVKSIITNLLGKEQLSYFCGWLKIACEALAHHLIMPGQVLILAGPQDCGKTLLQTEIITPLFGGQKADPYRFAVGRTEFSGDLCRAMHLMISDQKNPRNREDVREFIREIASNGFMLLHPKNKDASNPDMLHRLSISCNLGEKDLAIVPPLDGIENKVLLFKCSHAPIPNFTGNSETRKAFSDAIRAELPAFLNVILSHKIPDDLRDSRFGIKGYVNPELAQMVRRLDREEELLELIREHKQANPEWDLEDVTAGKIHKELFDQINLRDALRKIAISPDALGRLLTKLVARNDGIVTARTIEDHRTGYTINI